MSARWTLGAPPLRRRMSEIVEVTDGDRVGRARFRAADPSSAAPGDNGWLGEDGALLDWQPTHWRPAPRKRQVFMVD